MSGLSPETLFHFTDSFDNLVGILKNHFYPRYCYDEFSLTRQHLVGRAIPMVCFCDILLSQIKNHIDTYGHYGLGMSKAWAKENRLNPVLYVAHNSLLAEQLSSVVTDVLKKKGENEKEIHHYMEKWKGKEDINQEEWARVMEMIDNVVEIGHRYVAADYILRYLKPYSGRLYKGGQLISRNVRFYDEKEWRYVVPEELSKKTKKHLQKQEYFDDEIRSTENKKLEQQKFSLKFKPNDIKYVIVNDEDEIIEMMHQLQDIKGERYSLNTVQILTSRIITKEQIFTDF